MKTVVDTNVFVDILINNERQKVLLQNIFPDLM